MNPVEIEIWLFAVALSGAAVAGAGLSWWWNLRRAKQRSVALNHLTTKLTRAESDAHEANVAGRRYVQQIKELQDEIRSVTERNAELTQSLQEAKTQLQRHHANANVNAAQLANFEKQFKDIVGMESEIATLRVIASRVPDLERRLAQSADPEAVIDLREQRSEVTE